MEKPVTRKGVFMRILMIRIWPERENCNKSLSGKAPFLHAFRFPLAIICEMLFGGFVNTINVVGDIVCVMKLKNQPEK